LPVASGSGSGDGRIKFILIDVYPPNHSDGFQPFGEIAVAEQNRPLYILVARFCS